MKNCQPKAAPERLAVPAKTASRSTRHPTGQARGADEALQKPIEFGGPTGLEPTRYGDWEKAGRCTDF